jgi:hypothetical protein
MKNTSIQTDKNKEFTISCHYCDNNIETISDKNLRGFFSLINGKFTIINYEGDKEAVCDNCLKRTT